MRLLLAVVGVSCLCFVTAEALTDEAATAAAREQGRAEVGEPRLELQFGAPALRDAASGDVHEYELAGAGDLVSGTVLMRDLAGLIEIVDDSGSVRWSWYLSPSSRAARVGFVVPTAASRLRLKFFDRFDGGDGPQWAPTGLSEVVGTARGSYTLQLDRSTVAERMVGVDAPVREADSSSIRLQRLSRDLQQGDTGAVELFWQEVAGNGPLVESVPGNDHEIDVTFLWRERYDTLNVLLSWPGDGGRPEDYFLSRLAGTDVWHKTVRLRSGSRFEYGLSVNDRPEDRSITRQPDPLNPRTWPDDPTAFWVNSSVLDTPGAPDEQWALRTPARRGATEEKRITSSLTQSGTKRLFIYTPPGYSSTGGPYPLVFFFDGAVYASPRIVSAPTTLDNLIGDGLIRPAIVVFDPTRRGRPQEFQELSVAEWVRVQGRELADEILPWLRSSYPISSNPADVIIGGFSAGGRAAAHVAFNYPEVFGNVLSQSGSFRAREPGAAEPNSDAQFFLAAPRKPIRFYMEVGSYDNAPSVGLPLHEMLLDETNLMGNRHVRDVLRAKGYDVVYREVGAGHENVHWRAMLADGLMVLLGTEPR